jgi:hypothetical protein
MAEVTKVTSKARHLAFWCVILGTTFAFAAPRKISKDLQKQASQPWVNVIVQYRVPPSQKHFAKVAAKGGMLQQNLPVINGAAFTVKGSSLAALAKDSNVAYISLDRTVWATATVTDLYDQAVLAPYAWSRNFTGSGIGVAVIDSGITAGRFVRAWHARGRHPGGQWHELAGRKLSQDIHWDCGQCEPDQPARSRSERGGPGQCRDRGD